MIIVAGLALMLPAMINGSMLLFPDSVGYYNAGVASIDTAAKQMGLMTPAFDATTSVVSLDQPSNKGVSTSRSVYFGIPMVVIYQVGGSSALPLVMVMITITCLFNALPLLLRTDFRQSTLIIILLGLVTGLAVVADTALPDVFAGLMVMAMAIVFSFWPSLSKTARFGWLAVVLASCMFHKSNTAVAAIMIIAYALTAIGDRRRLRSIAALVAILVTALVSHAAVSIAVERVTKRPVIDAPFLLARIIGDGTAERYLDSHCAEQEFELCRFRGQMPMSENQFLWSHIQGEGVMGVVSLAEQQAIIAEGNTIVFGTLRNHPGAQLTASIQNFIAQFFLVGVTEYLIPPLVEQSTGSGLSPLLNQYSQSAVGRGTLPLVAQSTVMKWTYLMSFVAILGVVLGPRRMSFVRPFRPEVAALAWIMFGMIVNAAVSGVLAGVFDRYQGRLAWLMPLAALMALRIAFPPMPAHVTSGT